MAKNYYDMTNEEREKLKAKAEKREAKRAAKEQKKREREERRAPKREKNVIAIVGFVLAVNCIWLSFTGWWVWLDLIALVLCIFGIVNKPRNIRKYLALFGMGLALIAVINAVRVSNSWVVNPDNLNTGSTYETESAPEE